MKAVVFTGCDELAFRELPKPRCAENEVNIKIAKVSVCGTDIHKCAAAVPERLSDDSECIVGHEPVGWIDAVGEKVEGLAIGQRVLLAGVFGCGSCSQCLAGFNTACEKGVRGFHWNSHGVNAEYVTVPSRNVVLLPDTVSFDQALVATCAGGTAWTILQETELAADEYCAVIGLGPVGLATILFAKALGAEVIAIDVNEQRLELAQMLGADKVVHADDKNVVKIVTEFSQHLGVHVVAECAGAEQAQLQSFEIVRPRGRIGLAGLGAGEVSINLVEKVLAKQIRLIGCAATPLIYFSSMMKMMDKKAVPLEKMITHRFSFGDIADAFKLMRSGNCGKIAIELAEQPN